MSYQSPHFPAEPIDVDLDVCPQCGGRLIRPSGGRRQRDVIVRYYVCRDCPGVRMRTEERLCVSVPKNLCKAIKRCRAFLNVPDAPDVPSPENAQARIQGAGEINRRYAISRYIRKCHFENGRIAYQVCIPTPTRRPLYLGLFDDLDEAILCRDRFLFSIGARPTGTASSIREHVGAALAGNPSLIAKWTE